MCGGDTIYRLPGIYLPGKEKLLVIKVPGNVWTCTKWPAIIASACLKTHKNKTILMKSLISS